MNCLDVQKTLLRGREPLVSPELWQAFEEHLTDCSQCKKRLRETEDIRDLLREHCARLRAPQMLRFRIAGALPHRAA